MRFSVLKPRHLGLPLGEREALQSKQGRGIFGIDMRIVDAEGQGAA